MKRKLENLEQNKQCKKSILPSVLLDNCSEKWHILMFAKEVKNARLKRFSFSVSRGCPKAVRQYVNGC